MISKRQAMMMGAATLALGCVGLWLLWPHRSAVNMENARAGIEWFASIGPWPFFVAMAILPLFWAPVSPFLLVAPAFGTAVAIGGSLTALAVNMSLAWLVAGRWFSPFFERVVARYGYSPPRLSKGSMYGAALMLRIAPGVPFPLQNYLLGLARMPYGAYMLVSVPANALPVISVILLGDALIKGNATLALSAAFLVVVVVVAIRYTRFRLKRKQLEGMIDGAS